VVVAVEVVHGVVVVAGDVACWVIAHGEVAAWVGAGVVTANKFLNWSFWRFLKLILDYLWL